ncbi:cytidine deaminase-like protein [Thozetella sp. PMI_491]|nr:cytidine deaminase-like protein [Thozetella sp. PMI_491]
MAAAILSESAPTAGHKISIFFQSLLLLLTDALRQVLKLFPTSGRRTQPPSKSEPGLPAPPHRAPTIGHPTSSANSPVTDNNLRHTTNSLSDVKRAFPRTAPIDNREDTMAGSSDAEAQLATEFGAMNLAGPEQLQHHLADKTRCLNVQPPPEAARSSVAVDEQALANAEPTTGEDSQDHGGDVSEAGSGSHNHVINGLAGSMLSDVQCRFDLTAKTEEEICVHGGFMEQALDMARLALKTNETPVGCVLVHNGRVVAKGMNATNVTRNGTRHAELMAISALISYPPTSGLGKTLGDEGLDIPYTDPSKLQEPQWGDVDPADGHLYPYGQKLHPSPRVSRALISECILYVTVEPCIMCASLLRQLHIRKVYFGAVNDKFGGTGGVFRIHKNSPATRGIASAPGSPVIRAGSHVPRPTLDPRAATSVDIGESFASSLPVPSRGPHMVDQTGAGPSALRPLSLDGDGDGGVIEPGYDVEGGWGRDAAVTLLRQFYVQENGRAPAPRKKEGRAARLAAMMERDGHAGGPMSEAPLLALPPDAEESQLSCSASEASDKNSEINANLLLPGDTFGSRQGSLQRPYAFH